MNRQIPYRLILANGAFKSGSTWLREIVKHCIQCEAIPPRYALRQLSHWVNEAQIPRLLLDSEVTGPFLSKSHIYLPESIARLLKFDNIRILNVEREIKDVVVSAYFHYKRDYKKNVSFLDYYWSLGRLKAAEVLEYNANWPNDDFRIFKTSYEALTKHFESEVERLGAFLGICLSHGRVLEIKDKTSIQRLRQNWDEENKEEAERFFRKGIVGDWVNYFDLDAERDIENIKNMGLELAGRVKYHFLFRQRRRVMNRIERLRCRLSELTRIPPVDQTGNVVK